MLGAGFQPVMRVRKQLGFYSKGRLEACPTVNPSLIIPYRLMSPLLLAAESLAAAVFLRR